MGPPSTSAVTVVARLKPFLPHEQTGTKPAIKCMPDGRSVELLAPSGERKSFTFEAAFEPDATQEAFFHNAGVPALIDSALGGYASTVFAFGQTGAGKTYTMAGSAGATSDKSAKARAPFATERLTGAPGLVHMTAQWLYKRIDELPDLSFTVRATYLEIYNEQARRAAPRGSRGGSAATALRLPRRGASPLRMPPRAPAVARPSRGRPSACARHRRLRTSFRQRPRRWRCGGRRAAAFTSRT